jgi:cell division protein FtsZ
MNHGYYRCSPVQVFSSDTSHFTVIAAGFDDTDDSLTVLDNQNNNNAETAAPAAQETQPEPREEEQQQSTMQEEYISIDNPLIDSLGFGSSSKPSSSSQDYDLDDIFKMLGN